MLNVPSAILDVLPKCLSLLPVQCFTIFTSFLYPWQCWSTSAITLCWMDSFFRSRIMSLLRTPFSDITGNYFTSQNGHRCADFELNALECMEGAGSKHAYMKCKDYIDDWLECQFMAKQVNLLFFSFSLSFKNTATHNHDMNEARQLCGPLRVRNVHPY